jgi:hypothetical protein
MSQTGKQDLDEALASPGALEEQLGDWERRLRIRTWIHAGSALLFFIGVGVALWFFFEEPSKSTEAAGAAIAFGLIGMFQAILAISSRRQGRAAQRCKQALAATNDNRI